MKSKKTDFINFSLLKIGGSPSMLFRAFRKRLRLPEHERNDFEFHIHMTYVNSNLSKSNSHKSKVLMTKGNSNLSFCTTLRILRLVQNIEYRSDLKELG